MTLSGPLYEHNSTAFGLTRDSILNSSQYFHVTEGLIPDAMHDVLEGSLPFEIKELLKHLIADRVISISSLNETIKLFPYLGSDALNKPSPISRQTLWSADHHLRQNGMYIYCMNAWNTALNVTTTCSISNMVPVKTAATHDCR